MRAIGKATNRTHIANNSLIAQSFILSVSKNWNGNQESNTQKMCISDKDGNVPSSLHKSSRIWYHVFFNFTREQYHHAYWSAKQTWRKTSPCQQKLASPLTLQPPHVNQHVSSPYNVILNKFFCWHTLQAIQHEKKNSPQLFKRKIWMPFLRN